MPISFRKGALAFVIFATASSATSALAETYQILILDEAFFPDISYVTEGGVHQSIVFDARRGWPRSGMAVRQFGSRPQLHLCNRSRLAPHLYQFGRRDKF